MLTHWCTLRIEGSRGRKEGGTDRGGEGQRESGKDGVRDIRVARK